MLTEHQELPKKKRGRPAKGTKMSQISTVNSLSNFEQSNQCMLKESKKMIKKRNEKKVNVDIELKSERFPYIKEILRFAKF